MLAWMQEYLGKREDSNPRVSSQWLISDATGLTRMELYTSLDRPLSPSELDILRTTVKRRGTGEPLQYITGSAPFRYLDINVRPGVLIPRPETEVLVSEVLSSLPKPPKRRAAEYLVQDTEDKEVSDQDTGSMAGSVPEEIDAVLPVTADDAPRLLVADICTGSGCIACSLAYEHPSIDVVATDISPEACSLASENAAKFGLSDRVRVLECSFGDGIESRYMGAFDAVVANPPYIPTDVIDGMSAEVTEFEPSLALDGGHDGLAPFRDIAIWAKGALKKGGVFAVELHETTLETAADIAREYGFADVAIMEDLAGKPRVLKALI